MTVSDVSIEIFVICYCTVTILVTCFSRATILIWCRVEFLYCDTSIIIQTGLESSKSV